MVIPDANIARCQGVFADRDCSISMETGDLTLESVRTEDEGPYVCKKGFNVATWNSTHILRHLNVNGEKFTVVFFLRILNIPSSQPVKMILW